MKGAMPDEGAMPKGREAGARELLVDSYDAWYEEKLSADEQLAPWHLQAIDQRLIPPLAGADVLDIGCGSGVFARYLAEQGANVVAADFSPRAIEYARKTMLKDVRNARAIVADVHDLPFCDESFDLTVCSSTLEHVVDPDRALSEMVRVTKSGGTFLLLMPNYMSFVGLIRIAYFLRRKPFAEIGQPINHPLTIPVVAWKIRRAGCRITAVDGEYHVLRLPGASRTFQLGFLEGRWFRPLSKWLGLHAVIRAQRC
jgi:ubiquinone/menaquinone biosynthesis C-methylase UbiE